MKRAARHGFQGIKLYPSSWPFPAHDERVYAIYEEADRHGLLMVLHFGISIGSDVDMRHANPLDIHGPARDFPDTYFMIAHFGAGFFREVLMLMYQTENVVVDSSGSNSWIRYQSCDLTLEKVFSKMLNAAGPERVGFGTDSSFFPRGFRFDVLEAQFHAVSRAATKNQEEALRLIFKDNILRLTGFNLST